MSGKIPVARNVLMISLTDLKTQLKVVLKSALGTGSRQQVVDLLSDTNLSLGSVIIWKYDKTAPFSFG